MKTTYTTPTGSVYTLYADMMKQTHILIAGATGSGKSVVINGIISSALYKAPCEVQFILIDPKRVELIDYKNLPHTIKYASEPDDMVNALQYAMTLCDTRYKAMQSAGIKKYTGAHVYVIIDELADLMTTDKKRVTPLIQRLCQIGRAAGIHVIAATQCPLTTVIPTTIKVNFDAKVALRTVTAQHSRNIMDENGCEKLPRYGKAYYVTPDHNGIVNIPMIDETETARLIAHWKAATAAHSEPNRQPKEMPTAATRAAVSPTEARNRKSLFGKLFAR